MTPKWQDKLSDAGLDSSQIVSVLKAIGRYYKKICTPELEIAIDDPFEDPLPEDQEIGLLTLDLNEEIDRVLKRLNDRNGFNEDQLNLVSALLYEITHDLEERYIQDMNDDAELLE